jgi:predicted ATPase
MRSSFFSRGEHPLALVLDDLQWLDAATLDFVERLLTALSFSATSFS